MKIKRSMIWILFILISLSFSTRNSFGANGNKKLNTINCSRKYSLGSPVRIAQGQGDMIYVTDYTKKKVAVLRIKKNKITQFKKISINGNPLGLAVDQNNNIYVGNNTKNKVEVYTINSGLIYSLEGEIKRPNDIAIGSNGLIYIVASDENLIKIYNPDGTLQSSFGGYGKNYGHFNFPTGIIIDENNHEVIVSDFLNKMVQVFDYNGNWLRTIGGGWFNSEIERPQGLEVDNMGRIYVVDSQRALILVFNRSGDLISTFGEYGQGQGQLRTPLDIILDNNGNAYITSNQNSRIEIFKGVF